MNINGKFLKAWKVYEDNNIKKVDLGDSTKNQDGTYNNWTWFGCALFGKAKDVQIGEGDKVEVKSGLIEQNKVGDKYYTNIKIFDIEVMEAAQPRGDVKEQMVEVDNIDDDDLPF